MIPRSVTAPFRLVGTSASPVILPPGVLGDTGRGRVRSSLLVWCSSGQVVMAGRAARLPVLAPVLLSAWSMSVRCRSEVWER